MILTKKSIIKFVVIIFLCVVTLISIFNEAKVIEVKQNKIFVENLKPTIVIDAGHGGEDSGAVASDKTLEKDLNLEISLLLKDMFKAGGFNVVMTRKTDTDISSGGDTVKERKASDMNNRLKIYNSSEKNIVVSIHQNKFTQNKYKGTQVFYGTLNEGSSVLANSIKNSIKGMIQQTNTRQIKPSDSNIFLLSKAKVPAVIVECGFISNQEELNLLKESEYQKEIAFSIFCGVLDYYYTQN